MTVTLQGVLGPFKLPDLLTFLDLSQKSGTLVLASRGREATVYFRQGGLVYASSNQENLRLGAILSRAKKISKDVRTDLESQMLESGTRFGAVAVDRGILNEDELRSFLKIQVSEILFDCFVWSEGAFTFVDAMELPDYAVTISINVANLIMEGARRIDEWERCLQLLPDPAVVFRVAENPRDQGSISLSLEEWKVLFRVDGVKSLEQLCQAMDEDRIEIYRVVYGLYANKLIVPVVRDDDRTTQRQPEGGSRPVPATQPEKEQPAVAGVIVATTRLEVPSSPMPAIADDTDLLVSREKLLTFADVMRVSPARIILKKADGDVTHQLDNADYLIGRGPDNQVRLDDSGASQFHARVFRSAAGFMLEDLGSRNGTYVNGQRIDRRILQDNDKIQIGRSVLVYELL